MHPRLDVRRDDPVVDPFALWKRCGVDLPEPATEAGEGANVRLYRRAAEILQQVVVQVDAVLARLAGKNLMEIGEVIIDKMGEWLRLMHAWS